MKCNLILFIYCVIICVTYLLWLTSKLFVCKLYCEVYTLSQIIHVIYLKLYNPLTKLLFFKDIV